MYEEQFMPLTVYLSGEIHTNWREVIIGMADEMGLDINFQFPVLDHGLSDDCGVKLLGLEENKFWHDHKGAKLNALRNYNAIKKSDIVVVRFGEKYKQWNAAFDAGFAVASDIPLIVLHDDDNQHALKEVDASALVVLDDPAKVASALNYVITGKL
tara:strand:- start:20 stop:487 length:468 start_codon:yes stop_codon:yes gene_type:complete